MTNADTISCSYGQHKQDNSLTAKNGQSLSSLEKSENPAGLLVLSILQIDMEQSQHQSGLTPERTMFSTTKEI